RVGLTAEYRPSYRIAGFASRGKSYRAPSLYSLFWLDDMATRGNPDLEAETSDEWTGRLTFETATSNVTRCEASASEQRVRDLIVWRRTFDNYWKPFNLHQAHIQTLDLFFEQSLWQGRFRLNTGVNWTEARDDTDDRNTGGKYLTYRAPRTHRAGFVFDHTGIHVVATYRWVAARPILETNSKWLSKYEVMDLQSSYTFQIGSVELQSTVGCENALDSNYRIVRHAPMPLRQWYGGIRATVS
ncbi:TonB-dependent receptor, partial [bacterium]|nr:TonB-dependent receptor [bacterium]